MIVMPTFEQVMSAIYGAGWENRIDRRKMQKQYNANKTMFDNIAQKAMSGTKRFPTSMPTTQAGTINMPGNIKSIPSGPSLEKLLADATSKSISSQLSQQVNNIENPTIREENVIAIKAIPSGSSYEDDSRYWTNPETNITYDKTSPEYNEFYNNYLKKRKKDALKREAKFGANAAREGINNEAFRIGAPIVGASLGASLIPMITPGISLNAGNIVNTARTVGDAAKTVGRFVNNKGAEEFMGNMYKYMPTSFMQQGGAVQPSDAQAQFVKYLSDIFGVQDENQLGEVVKKLGKQGLAQLQKAFQQGIPAEQVRQQMMSAQSAKMGAKITKTGDFVPCAKCGGKAKKKRFKGSNGMSITPKPCVGCNGGVMKKENGGTVPETWGRPIGGATALQFLLKDSNKKGKRFNER